MPEEPTKYVELSAQIIPVLVLALLADPLGQVIRPPSIKPLAPKSGRAGLVLAALGAGVVGEILALVSVRVGSEVWSDGVIAWCMALLTFAILKPHVLQYFGIWLSPLPPQWRYVAKQVPTFIYIYGYLFWFTLHQTSGRTERVFTALYFVGVLIFVGILINRFKYVKQSHKPPIKTVVVQPDEDSVAAGPSGGD